MIDGAPHSRTCALVVSAWLLAAAAASAHVRVDRTAPSLSIRSPVAGAWLAVSPVTVTATVSDRGSGVARVTCGGRAAAVRQGRVRCLVKLRRGSNAIRLRAVDRAGNARVRTRRVMYAPGVLPGPPGARALASVRDTASKSPGIRRDQTVRDGPLVARTMIEIAFAPGARIGQIDALLESIRGQIISSLAGVAVLEVRIPDPHTLAGLHGVIGRVKHSTAVRYVNEGVIAGADELPSNLAASSSGDIQKLAGQFAIRAPAAWNARALIARGRRPTVVVADFFGGGVPDVALDAAGLTAAMFGSRADTHGYAVAGVITGSFGGAATDRGKVTGIFPGTSQMRVVDVTNGLTTNPLVDQALIQAIKAAPGNVVVNTSLNSCGSDGLSCPSGAALNGAARAWIEDVRGTASAGVAGAGLERKFLQISSAGNLHSGGPLDSTSNSEYDAAHLLAAVTAAGGGRLPSLTNVIVVEGDYAEDAAAGSAGIDCLDATSKRPGDISAVGDVFGVGGLWTLTGATAGAGFEAGTSFATPQVAGLAEYVWTLEPRLSPQQLASLIKDTAQRPLAVLSPDAGCDQTRTPAPAVDAYAALLSLDTTEAPLPGDQPTREALLDSSVDLGRPGFNENDLGDFLPAYFDPAGAAIHPTDRDYGRFDLNGDGFTGGDTKARFDLDRTGSHLWGTSTLSTVTQTILTIPVTFDETGVSDLQILCYYAYSPLYTGDRPFRDQQLGPRCLPKLKLAATFASTAIPGTPQPLEISVRRPDFPAAGQSAPQPGVRIELSATGGTVGTASGTTDSAGTLSTTGTLASAASTITITITARAGAGGPILDQTTVHASSGSVSNIDVLTPDNFCRSSAGANDPQNGGMLDSKEQDVLDNAVSLSFNSAASDTYTPDGGAAQSATGHASANCTASVSTSGGKVTYTGHCAVSGDGSVTGDLVSGGGAGDFTLRPKFTVKNSPVAYRVQGTLTVSDADRGGASVSAITLPDFKQAIPTVGTSAGNLSVPVDQSGTLQPGQYLFDIDCGVAVGGSWPDKPSASASGGYDITLTLIP
ncbi:MAG TPA: S8 family serine peptidase [Solirubrobacteraceae bacterium]|nr:S8 family serine peptidase [Solirubrobacteraceae bacterium]